MQCLTSGVDEDARWEVVDTAMLARGFALAEMPDAFQGLRIFTMTKAYRGCECTLRVFVAESAIKEIDNFAEWAAEKAAAKLEAKIAQAEQSGRQSPLPKEF